MTDRTTATSYGTDSESTYGSGGGNARHNGGLVDKVRETAAAQLTNQKNRATDGLGSVAQAVRQSTQQLRDQRHETIAGYVEQAAGQIDKLSQRLRDKDVTELMNDVQRLARRQPAAFIGGAFALGLVGARFLKSSSAEQDSATERGYSGSRMSDRGSGGRMYRGSSVSPLEPGVTGHASGAGLTIEDTQSPTAIPSRPSPSAGEGTGTSGATTAGSTGRTRRTTPGSERS